MCFGLKVLSKAHIYFLLGISKSPPFLRILLIMLGLLVLLAFLGRGKEGTLGAKSGKLKEFKSRCKKAPISGGFT